MTHSARRLAGLWAVLAMVGAALLACTLTWDNAAGTTPQPSNAGGGGGVSAPNVQILDPASGVRVPVNLPVDITVATDSTTTAFLLSVGGRVAGTKALPQDQPGPAQAILSWMPDHEGTFSLEVVAFNGSAASAPAAIMLDVSGTASASGSVASCTGRVVVASLNFRDAPGTGATLLGQFALGETVTVIGRNGDTSWYQVQRSNGGQVWVINNMQWMPVDGPCDGLPVTG